MGVAVEEGQTLPNLHVRIPRPVRHRVKGRVIAVLPPERKYISIQFRRELGVPDQVGWAGGAVIQPDGQFEGLEQPGRYYAEICQFTPPGLAEESVGCGPWAAPSSPSDLKTCTESKFRSIATPPKSSQAKGMSAGD